MELSPLEQSRWERGTNLSGQESNATHETGLEGKRHRPVNCLNLAWEKEGGVYNISFKLQIGWRRKGEKIRGIVVKRRP